MIHKRFEGYRLILASNSPRRQYLLKELGLRFEIMVTHVEENYPDLLRNEEIAIFLAEKKADSFEVSGFNDETIIIAADTIVCVDHEVLGKPSDYQDAISMLTTLSGKRHEVITAVCLKSRSKKRTFSVSSFVYFKDLTAEEIGYYVENFRPYDKAGGYGIQEWIGYVGISKIEGSYFNIMGLPVKEFYEELLEFVANP